MILEALATSITSVRCHHYSVCAVFKILFQIFSATAPSMDSFETKMPRAFLTF